MTGPVESSLADLALGLVAVAVASAVIAVRYRGRRRVIAPDPPEAHGDHPFDQYLNDRKAEPRL